MRNGGSNCQRMLLILATTREKSTGVWISIRNGTKVSKSALINSSRLFGYRRTNRQSVKLVWSDSEVKKINPLFYRSSWLYRCGSKCLIVLLKLKISTYAAINQQNIYSSETGADPFVGDVMWIFRLSSWCKGLKLNQLLFFFLISTTAASL